MARQLGQEDKNTGFFIGHRSDGTSALIGTITMWDMYNGMVTQHQQFPGQFQSYSARLGVNLPNAGDFNLFNNYSQYAVSNIINHPSYGGPGPSRNYDFGIVHFYQGIPGIETLTLSNGERNIGDIYSIHGGGFSGVVGTTPVLDGNTRVVFNRLESYNFEFEWEGVQDAYLSFRFDAPGSANFVDGEGMGWEHDSGASIRKLNTTTMQREIDALLALASPPDFGGRFHATPIPRDFAYANRWSVVPEPSSVGFVFVVSLAIVTTRRRAARVRPSLA